VTFIVIPATVNFGKSNSVPDVSYPRRFVP